MEEIRTILSWIAEFGTQAVLSAVLIFYIIEVLFTKKKTDKLLEEQRKLQISQASILSNLVDIVKPQAETLKEIVTLTRESMQAAQEAILELTEMKKLYEVGYLEEISSTQAAKILKCALRVSQLRVFCATLDLVNLNNLQDQKIINEKVKDVCDLSFSMLIQDLANFKYGGRSLGEYISDDWIIKVSPIVKNYINQMPPRDCRVFMHNLEQRLELYVNQLTADI